MIQTEKDRERERQRRRRTQKSAVRRRWNCALRERKTGKRSPGLEVRYHSFVSLFFPFIFLSISSFPRSDPLPPSLDTPAIVCVRARRVISKSPFEILNLDSYADLSAQPVTRSLDTLPATRGLQFRDPAIRFLSQKEDARYHAISIDFKCLTL